MSGLILLVRLAQHRYPLPTMGSSDDDFKGLFGLAALGRTKSPLAASSPLANTLWPGGPLNALGNVLAAAPPKTKRRVYFSFHFDDIMRVNNVRNAWKIDHPDNALYRSFQDSSLWERKQLEGDNAVKRLIREGVQSTSVVCVLAGTETWLRRWVRYEVARAVVDGRGLLTVHINGLNHHQTRAPSARGENPLDSLGVGKVRAGLATPKYYLFERTPAFIYDRYVWEWPRYSDYTDPVELPPWLSDPAPGHITPLSFNATEYDYVQSVGHKNIGAWIDAAAMRAGR
jgi:hypothetical protein